MTEALATRRDELNASLLVLEREQGAALLDGRPIDMAPLIAARNELSALDMAKAEATRRERVEDTAAVAAARAKARDALKAETALFQTTLKAAEKKAAALVDDLLKVERSRGIMFRLIRQLGTMPPVALEGPEARNILSRLLAAQLNRLGHTSQFGIMDWSSVLPASDWAAHLSRLVEPTVASLTGAEQ